MEHGRSQGFSQQNNSSRRNNPRQRSEQPQNWRERNSETSPSVPSHSSNFPVRQGGTHQPQNQRMWSGRCSGRGRTSPANNTFPTYRDNRPRGRSNGVSKFTYKINPDAKLTEKEVEGIRILTDYEQVRNIQKRIAEYTNGGSSDFFSSMASVSLSEEHFEQIETTSYFVAPKPDGYRCLLYVNEVGEIFLQARSVHIFQMDPKYAVDFFDSRSCTADTLLDTMLRTNPLDLDTEDSVGDVDSSKASSKDSKTEKKNICAFYVMDAMRVDGRDLTHLSVDQRISIAKEKIMMPMWEALKPKKVSEQQEKFGLYIVDYVRRDEAEGLLNPEFQNSLDYPPQLLLFVSENQSYRGGTCPSVFLWHGKRQSSFFFRLRIPDDSTGEHSSNEGDLLALNGNIETPLAKIGITDEMRQLNGRIIRCSFEEGQWKFLSGSRRCYPNSHRTIQGKLESDEHPVELEDLRNFFTKLARREPIC